MKHSLEVTVAMIIQQQEDYAVFICEMTILFLNMYGTKNDGMQVYIK